MNDEKNAKEQNSPVSKTAPTVKGYAWLVLALLTLTNVLSFMDRYLINIVGQPIKLELGLTDAELGLLTGFALTLSYSAVGLPLAWLAERRNRVLIISGSILTWSLMTALCGQAMSFAQLALFRVGVGVGEAGAVPASHSLITDYFPVRRRALALAIFTAALPLGGLIGSISGGWIVDHFSWREAFIYLGVPGIVVALVFSFLVKEVPRGRHDEKVDETRPRLRMSEVAGMLWRDPVMRHAVLGLTTTMLLLSAATAFYAPFLSRKFGVNYTTIGLVISATYLAGAFLGNLMGGFLADRLSPRDLRWPMWIPAIGLGLSAPLFFLAYLQPTLHLTGLYLFFPCAFALVYTPPTFAILHARTDPRSRSSMVAIVQLISNLFGVGLGPFLSGLAIDTISEARFAGSFTTTCVGKAGAAAPVVAQCAEALLHGTVTVLVVTAPLMFWPVVHYLLAAKAIGREKPSTRSN